MSIEQGEAAEIALDRARDELVASRAEVRRLQEIINKLQEPKVITSGGGCAECRRLAYDDDRMSRVRHIRRDHEIPTIGRPTIAVFMDDLDWLIGEALAAEELSYAASENEP